MFTDPVDIRILRTAVSVALDCNCGFWGRSTVVVRLICSSFGLTINSDQIRNLPSRLLTSWQCAKQMRQLNKRVDHSQQYQNYKVHQFQSYALRVKITSLCVRQIFLPIFFIPKLGLLHFNIPNEVFIWNRTAVFVRVKY